jgi:hypothetical protein
MRMTSTLAAERRLLSDEELEPVMASIAPVLETLSRPELLALARWLRSHQTRLRDVTRRRVRSAKAVIGGVPQQGSEPGLAAKQQVFARALKRVNGRLHHLAAEAKRAHDVAALAAMLARRRTQQAAHPNPGVTANAGISARPSGKRRTIVSGRRIGSVSQAGKVAQAARDHRGAP